MLVQHLRGDDLSAQTGSQMSVPMAAMHDICIEKRQHSRQTLPPWTVWPSRLRRMSCDAAATVRGVLEWQSSYTLPTQRDLGSIPGCWVPC